MAGKPLFLFFALSLLSVLASAHRPFVVEKHEAAMELSGMMKSHHNELKTDMENPIDGEKNKVHDMGKREMTGKRLEHNDAPESVDGGMNKMHDMGKWEMIRKREEQVDAASDDQTGNGLYDAPNQESYPGADGGFHMDFGPIGFGFGGGFEWGGNPSPLYVVPPYGAQPYVVVSPYSLPYSTSSPYPYPTPYQQPRSGYNQPGSGYGMPQSGQDGPYPSEGGYAQGQGPYQNGWGSNSPNN